MWVVADGMDIEFDGYVCTLSARSRFSAWTIGGRERKLRVAQISHLAVTRGRSGAIRRLALALKSGRLDLYFTEVPKANAALLRDALLSAGVMPAERISLSGDVTSSPPESAHPLVDDGLAGRREVERRFALVLAKLLEQRALTAIPDESVRIRLTNAPTEQTDHGMNLTSVIREGETERNSSSGRPRIRLRLEAELQPPYDLSETRGVE
ncbi:6-phosphogluconolactonase [Curtobacterium sp. MCSS17_006]|uniref:6-phosphogluconolactonase n=1 Tax=Curtobacterium sp. MCSS17_006 TaxID=2175642 RepID=UPI0011B457E0|nr:6-phosphogluconolactonase [Curtobacterium sp. MCSS17_006]